MGRSLMTDKYCWISRYWIRTQRYWSSGVKYGTNVRNKNVTTDLRQFFYSYNHKDAKASFVTLYIVSIVKFSIQSSGIWYRIQTLYIFAVFFWFIFAREILRKRLYVCQTINWGNFRRQVVDINIACTEIILISCKEKNHSK